MCSRPRKPQRNPNPSAADVSGSKKKRASFSRSFSSASRSSGYSWPSTGYRPAKTIGLSSLKPGNGSAVGRAASVMVSPIFASLDLLDVGDEEPDLAGAELVDDSGFGVNTPTCFDS